MADGTVIIIGGAEDKVRDRVILEPIRRARGRRGRDDRRHQHRVARSALEAGERYREVFGELGVKRVRPLHAVTRPQANDEHRGLAVARRDRRSS